MSSSKMKIAALIILVVCTVGNALAKDVDVSLSVSDYAVILHFKDLADDKPFNVTYGDTFKIETECVGVDNVTLKIYRIAGDALVKTYTVANSQTITVDTEAVDMKPALYYFEVEAYVNDTYIGSNNTKAGYPANFSVDPSSYERPIVEIEVKNPSNKVVVGDKIKFTSRIWGRNTGCWYLIGPYNSMIWGYINGSDNYAERDVCIYTYAMFNNSTLNPQLGGYEIKVESGESARSFTISIEKPAITANVNKSEVVPGDSIEVSGVTNLVQSGSEFDCNGSNTVCIFIFNTTDYGKDDLKYNASLKAFTLRGVPIAYINGTNVTRLPNTSLKLQDIKSTVILSSGKFSGRIDIPRDADAGGWEAIVTVMAVTNDTLLWSTILNEPGTRDVNDKLIGEDIVYFSVRENVPPVPSFVYSPKNPTVNQTVIFNISSSYDPDGQIVSFQLNFGDGCVVNGTWPAGAIEHTYSKAGNYTVNLTVTDNSGVSNSTSKIISVRERRVLYVDDDLSLPANFTTIQQAIDSAGYGDTIIVYNGTYYENITINKRLRLIGIDRPVIYTTLFKVVADGCFIRGFTIKNETFSLAKLTQTAIVGKGELALVINVTKPFLEASLEKNSLARGESVRIYGNTSVSKVFIYTNESYIFYNVTKLPSTSPFSTNGSYFINVTNSTFEGSLVVNRSAPFGKYKLYVFAPSNESRIDPAEDPRCVFTIEISPKAVFEVVSTNNTIEDNVIIGNAVISSNNLLTKNTFCGVTYVGGNNTLYLNDFLACVQPSGINVWNSTQPMTYIYNGTEHTNHLGNYWSNYNGTDSNLDGIGDTPFVIDSKDQDNYPLIQPFENYMPDLTVESLIVRMIAGNTYSIGVKIANTGSSTATNFNVLLTANGNLIGKQSVMRLAVGRSITLTFLWTPSAGIYRLLAVVDPENAVTESNEANNKKSVSVSVSAATHPVVGGGGGGYVVPPTEAKPVATYMTVKYFPARQPVTIVLPSDKADKTGVLKLTARTAFSESLHVTVARVKLPATIAVPAYDVYSFFEILFYKASGDIVEPSGEVEFKVSKDWMSNKGYDVQQVVLMKYENTWIELETECIGEDDVNYYFRAKIDSFSVFAIAAKPKPAPTKSTTVVPTPTATALPTATVVKSPTVIPTITPTTPVKWTVHLEVILLVTCLIAAIAVLTYLLRKFLFVNFYTKIYK